MDTPLTAPQLKAAPQLIQTLLRDIVLQCQTCRKDIKACENGAHQCSGEPTKAEVQIASLVFKKLASTCHTEGTVRHTCIINCMTPS